MTNKRCLVYETLGKVTNLQVSESAAPKGMMRLEGVFGVCGVKNQNNRIYDKENYGKMVEALQEVIKEDNGCPGELEHPNSMNINLENVSHKIEKIQMNEDGTITGTILLLNTPKGQIAQAIVEGGLPLYISSRGAGTITNESGISHVTLSTIKTYDLVGTPGFSQAKLNLKENQTLECLNESVDDGNVMYAIVEGDDDQPSDDKDKDTDKGEGDADNKDNKTDDTKDNKDDNKNNDNEKVDMKDLKEAIEKLTDKVTSLEAELHVAKESLDNQKPVNYAAIEKWVNEEFAPEFKKTIETALQEKLDGMDVMESVEEIIDNKINESIETISEGIQNWVVEEFAPEVQNWVVEEFAPEVQNWVCEEFAPEVQNWVCEEFAPEVQNWVVEEFAPEVQNWITEEYSPEVQNWITEEFAPVIDKWVNEEFAPEHMENVEKKVNENVSAFLAENKAGRLEEIDSLLETIGSNNTPLENIVKENQEQTKWKGVYVVESMPAQYKPSWELLDEARQEEIVRSSKLYDFTKAGVLESFWANVEFNKKEEKIEENLNPIQKYHNTIAEQMRRIGKW